MTIIATISSTQLRRALGIRERIDVLEHELRSILGASEAASRPAPTLTPRKYGKRRKMSAEGRARMAASMKARWRKAKKAGRSTL